MKKVYEKPDIYLIMINAYEEIADQDPDMSGNLEDEEF